MTGEALEGAAASYDTIGRPKIDISFTDAGAGQFANLTDQLATQGAISGNVQRMAIVLDDEVVSAPTVKEKITGNKAEITGNMSLDEVKNIVLVLQTGALPVELEIVERYEK
jgi:preprotein translocase subunit SecD